MSIFNRSTKKSQPSTATPAPAVAATAPAPVAAKGRRTSAVSYRALVRPVVSEKAAELAARRQYVFIVDRDLNKLEIAKAVNQLYGVQPAAVNILNMRGKRVRYGRSSGVRKDWKKAIVTLRQGDSIEIYHGV